jgi:hypothetical protein
MIGTSISRDIGRLTLCEMSPEDKKKSIYGDKKQGNNLVNKKFSTPSYHTKMGKIDSSMRT